MMARRNLGVPWFLPVSVLVHAMVLASLRSAALHGAATGERPIRVTIMDAEPALDAGSSKELSLESRLEAEEPAPQRLAVAEPRKPKSAAEKRAPRKRSLAPAKTPLREHSEEAGDPPVGGLPSATGSGSGFGSEGAEGAGNLYAARRGVTEGSGGGGGDPLVAYLHRVRALIDARKRYPEEARRMGTEGVAVLRFVIEQDGSVAKLQLLSADDRRLAAAALSAVKEAARWIGPPPGRQAIPVQVALRFELKTGKSEEKGHQ
jgi:protein TonB